jgi:hypothetical protein
MKKSEAIQLIRETVKNIELIKSFFQEIEKSKQAIIEANEKINGENGLVLQIEKKSQEINEAHNEIMIDDENGDSVKTQLENHLKKFEEDENKFNELRNNLFGYEKQNDAGEVQKIKGLFEEINDFHQKQKEKYVALYNKIEQELKAGTTSVNLSKSFADKVREYFWGGVVWSGLFIVVTIAIIVYSYITISSEGQHIITINDAWRFLIFRAPLIAFAVWLVGFLGNRRAESKKLEESYKHKEVIARSFVGYRETIEDLNDLENKLLEKHMNNLLGAININSSEFLNFEGEKYPFVEGVLSCFGKNKKIESKKDEPQNN